MSKFCKYFTLAEIFGWTVGLGVLLGFVVGRAQAGEYKLLSADRLDFTVTRFLCNKTPLAPDIPCQEWRGRTAVNFDLSFADTIQWRNQVHAEGTAAKYETVGWQFEIVLPLGEQVELLYQHHSQHRMDAEDASHTLGEEGFTGYPVEDSWGLRMCFLGDCK